MRRIRTAEAIAIYAVLPSDTLASGALASGVLASGARVRCPGRTQERPKSICFNSRVH
ncbi:hypothetical protein [Streptomyces heilongjiangensis]|uniref:Uncharacterized protein n=1 Tax=Streptomyces heilongjiangensis TaxID=945052 RepID=A0ABW1B3E0_9ACTN|nr:hypothetical protein [Streptomyces heilongjiangensis]MDC2945817.1 hypothetical protein [Streptomyces heilongjiangensis]